MPGRGQTSRPNGRYVPQVPGCRSAALPATAPKCQGCRARGPRVNRAIDINVRILELVRYPTHVPLVALRPLIHATASGERSGGDELAIRGKVGHGGVTAGETRRSHHLNILLRHHLLPQPGGIEGLGAASRKRTHRGRLFSRRAPWRSRQMAYRSRVRRAEHVWSPERGREPHRRSRQIARGLTGTPPSTWACVRNPARPQRDLGWLRAWQTEGLRSTRPVGQRAQANRRSHRWSRRWANAAFTISTFSCDIARTVSRLREHGVFGGRSARRRALGLEPTLTPVGSMFEPRRVPGINENWFRIGTPFRRCGVS